MKPWTRSFRLEEVPKEFFFMIDICPVMTKRHVDFKSTFSLVSLWENHSNMPR